MILNYTYDYILIGLVLIGSMAGIIQIIRLRHELNNYKYAIPFILGGLIILIFSTIGNSYFENNWENEYIIAFLILKKVSRAWLLRHLCSWGYIFLFWGTTMLFAVATSKRTKK